MSFTVADVVLEARELLLDETEPYRYSDTFIVRKVNQVVRRMVQARPDLFTAVGTITTVPGSLQTCPSDSYRLMDVALNGANRVPKEVNQDVLDLMFPSWNTGSTGATTNWMRYQRDANRFYVYPPSAGGETLTVAYAKTPGVLGADDVVPVQDAFQPTVLDGTCWLMESLDAEHVESGRAKMFKDAFETSLVSSLGTRRITDSDEGAMPETEVK